jgi:hypothetical protein
MKEDYLWDKSGEPDAEIAELEQTLGRLRYKRPVEPQPLPTTSRTRLRPLFSPAFAIAATLVILLLAGGLWLGLRRANNTGGRDAAAVDKTPGISQPAPVVSGPPPPTGTVKPIGDNVAEREIKESINPSPLLRRNIHRVPNEQRQTLAQAQTVNNARRIRREEIARGQEAKAQLIKALLITSDKLNEVQKKIQETQERNPIS